MRRIVFDSTKNLLVDHSDIPTLEEYFQPELRKRYMIRDDYAGSCLKAILDAMLQFKDRTCIVIFWKGVL